MIILLKNLDIPDRYISYSIKKPNSNEFDKNSILPLTLLFGALFNIIVTVINAFSNKYKLSFYITFVNIIAYFGVIIFLVIYSLKNNIEATDD